MVSNVLCDEVRQKIITAFRELRKQGFITHINYLCCGGCAGYAIASKVEKMNKKKRSKIKGVIFWTRQDEKSFYEDGDLYLYYGEIDTNRYGTVGLPTKEVGNTVVRVLKEKGLNVIWDGNENSRILVKVQ